MFNKYKNNKTSGFASKLEASLNAQLLLLERAKEISEIQSQDHVHLTNAKILYIADFKYKNRDGVYEWAEAKGFETDVWRIKRRLWMHYGPGKLTVYKGSASRLKIHEIIVPNGKN